MPLSLRFVVPLALALAAIAFAVVPLVDRLTLQWFVRDLDARGAVIAKTAQEPLVELLREPRGAKLRVQRYFDRIMQGERIYGLGFCDRAGKLVYASRNFPQAVRCSPASERPQARSYVLDDQRALRRHMTIFVDGRAIRDRAGLADRVAENSTIHVFQALSGG